MHSVHRKCAAAPEPDLVEFLLRNNHHVRRVPMLASPPASRRLRRVLAQMHTSALGLDGWSLVELRALLSVIVEWLAELLQEVECRGR